MRPGQPLEHVGSPGARQPTTPGFVPFIHLHKDGETVAQSDGPPFSSSKAPPCPWTGDSSPCPRTSPQTPPQATGESIIGLYNPADGSRAEIDSAGGTELLLAPPPTRPRPHPRPSLRSDSPHLWGTKIVGTPTRPH